jgi:hypothetical protein
VRDHLAENLMNLSPCDNWLMDPSNNWCLADADGRVLLFYSLTGTKITLVQKLPASHYTGVWFNPRQGHCQPAELPQLWNPGDSMVKPTQEDWLLLLRATP